MSRDDLRRKVLQEILPTVRTPGQYAGGELNSVVKDHRGVDVTWALVFPDLYTIGMSHLGLRILYHVLNEREDCAAERVFAPDVDMEEALRSRGLPLYSLETFTPLHRFDVVGFSLQYELSFTNILNLLDLGETPIRTRDRGMGDPLVIAGGAIASSSEPIADFVDFIVIGDSEEVVGEITETVKRWKDVPGLTRREYLEKFVSIPGVYVPSFYRVSYHDDGTLAAMEPEGSAPATVAKLTTFDLNETPFPVRPVVPNVPAVHERINIEIMRGCPHGCRFCQAVKNYRPLKYRTVEKVIELAEAQYRSTGYEEISLTSLSTADYPHLFELLEAIAERFESRRLGVSLPSLRVGPDLRRIPRAIAKMGKSGLTIAPEVATDRLREVIKKRIRNDLLFQGVEAAWESGWRLLKFYFMIGVPTETEEDIAGIYEMAEHASRLRKRLGMGAGKVNVGVSSFIPKPHTPFQWEPMDTMDELERKQRYLLSLARSRRIQFKLHDVRTSYMEAVFSRGDRRLGDALELALEAGCKFDAWNEHFSFELWMEVFRQLDVDPDWYVLRRRPLEEKFPWDVVALGPTRSYLETDIRRVWPKQAVAGV
jgi:radical SAM family uncharacterized protein